MKENDRQSQDSTSSEIYAEGPRCVADAAAVKHRILRERAADLSREDKETAAAGDTIEVVEFLLAYEKYAVETRFVREVRTLKELTPIPCTPKFIAGMINVRSQILTVINIKSFFELPDRGIEDLHHVLILRTDSMELAVLADLIHGVRRLPLDGLQVSLPTLTGVRADYLKGITPEGLVVLDVEKILSSEKIIVHDVPDG